MLKYMCVKRVKFKGRLCSAGIEQKLRQSNVLNFSGLFNTSFSLYWKLWSKKVGGRLSKLGSLFTFPPSLRCTVGLRGTWIQREHFLFGLANTSTPRNKAVIIAKGKAESTYFPSGLYTFPNAKETYHPDKEET